MTSPLTAANLNLLVSLNALLEEQSVTRAARRVGVSQPAMSRHLSALRDWFGDELLVRVGDQMQPTTRAEALTPLIRRLLADAERILDGGPAFDPSTAKGMLRVDSADFVLATLAPALASALAYVAPHLTLRMQLLALPELSERLRSGVADLSVGPAQSVTAGIDSRILGQDDFALLVREGHPLGRTPVSMEAFAGAGHILISPTGHGRSAVDAQLEELGLQRRVVVQVESFLVAPFLVAASDLVLTAPRSSIELVAADLPVQVLELPVEIQPLRMAMYWESRRADEPLLSWFRELVVHSIMAR